MSAKWPSPISQKSASLGSSATWTPLLHHPVQEVENRRSANTCQGQQLSKDTEQQIQGKCCSTNDLSVLNAVDIAKEPLQALER